MSIDVKVLNEKIYTESAFLDAIIKETGQVIVGQKYMIERLLIAMLSGGHILLEGLPGLAKTLTIKTLSDTIHTEFHRIQFTPDLLPADILGTLIYNQKDGKFITRQGPIFANLILADEINRSPAKVQSALLEAMQERQITISDKTYPLPDPFLVMATQNPIEQEGTYPLPEAQVDRFLFKLRIGYPTREEEIEIMRRMGNTREKAKVKTVSTPEDILRARKTINDIYMDEKIENYIADLIFATREPEKYNLKELKPLIQFGASPRASINLTIAARAYAFLKRRGYVIPDDVRAMAPDILRHRVLLTFEAEAEELTSDEIIAQVLNKIEVP